MNKWTGYLGREKINGLVYEGQRGKVDWMQWDKGSVRQKNGCAGNGLVDYLNQELCVCVCLRVR